MSGGSWWVAGRRPEPPLDAGLQAERTSMAWQRTALGVGGVGALLLHHTGGYTWAAAPGVAGLLVALVLLFVAELRYERTVRRVQAGHPASSVGLVRLLAGVTVMMSVAALVMVVFSGF